jgi:hypothetical protein
MKFVPPSQQGHHLIGAKELYTQLDYLMADDWQSSAGEIASVLVSLRSNLTAVHEIIKKCLEHKTWPKMNGAQSFYLFEGHNVVVRINLWFPSGALNPAIDRLRKYLSVGELHNHDFDFFTICLLGSGYSTHFYRDKKYSGRLRKGDQPDLEDLGIFHLQGDSVLYVEKDIDYHLQHWPNDFTVTLNAIPRKTHSEKNIQYILDSKTLTIKTVISEF